MHFIGNNLYSLFSFSSRCFLNVKYKAPYSVSSLSLSDFVIESNLLHKNSILSVSISKELYLQFSLFNNNC